MKKIIVYLLLTLLICVNFACTTVGTNNKVANGDVELTEDNSNLSNPAGDPLANGKDSKITEEEKTPKASEGDSPEALVNDLYKAEENENSPFLQNKDRVLVTTYFTKSLADLIWKDAVETTEDEVGKIDFDPLYDAQDVETAELKIGDSEIKGEKATVVVTFLNFGEEQSVEYQLTKENGEWKIEDINYKEDSLVKVLTESKTETPEND